MPAAKPPVVEKSLLATWLEQLDGGPAPKQGDRSVAVPSILQACTLEVLLGKMYSSSEPANSTNALHTWTSTVSDPNGMEAVYTTQVFRQPGGAKFKYCLRLKAVKGSILLLHDINACVKRARKRGEDEIITLTQLSGDPHSFDFCTNVHCRRELDLRVSFLILMKAEAPSYTELDYRPPSTQVLYDKRQETGDLTLTAVDADGVTSSFPVHSPILKLCCAYFETALGDSWKKGSAVALPILAGPEAAELLVIFVYLGKAKFTELLGKSTNFDTAEQLYLLGDAMDIHLLRKLAGERIEQQDFVRRALCSKLKDHEHFAATHLEQVAENGRDMAMKHSARAQVELIGAILQACPEEWFRKRSADEMMETDEAGMNEVQPEAQRPRVDS